MKKSELRSIIKEAINEQVGSYVGPAVNYDQNAGMQQIVFSMCQCEIIDQNFPSNMQPYTDLNVGCCYSLTLLVNGNIHGNSQTPGGTATTLDITSVAGGMFWTAIQNAQAGNTSGHMGIYADPNHCSGNCPTVADLGNPNVVASLQNNPGSGDACYNNSYQNGVPACPHAQTAPTVGGCTDSTANNYDPNATVDDGSCDFTCTDPLYQNCGNTQNLPCDGLVSDMQATIDANSIEGCADSSATNYDPNATGCLYDYSIDLQPYISSFNLTGPLALGELPANQCGVVYTGLANNLATQCCTYGSSTSGNTNYMPGGVGNVTGPTGPTAPLASKSTDITPNTTTPDMADPAVKRMQRLANLEKRKK